MLTYRYTTSLHATKSSSELNSHFYSEVLGISNMVPYTATSIEDEVVNCAILANIWIIPTIYPEDKNETRETVSLPVGLADMCVTWIRTWMDRCFAVQHPIREYPFVSGNMLGQRPKGQGTNLGENKDGENQFCFMHSTCGNWSFLKSRQSVNYHRRNHNLLSLFSRFQYGTAKGQSTVCIA